VKRSGPPPVAHADANADANAHADADATRASPIRRPNQNRALGEVQGHVIREGGFV
jgi:hypothetical protein